MISKVAVEPTQFKPVDLIQSGNESTPKEQEQYKDNSNTEWVSATKIRNTILGDSVIDFFKRVYPLPRKTEEEVTSFSEFIMRQGQRFEEGVYKLMRKRFGSNFHQVNTGYPINPNAFTKTKALMKRQVPIIAQGLLCDPDEKLLGIPDLIVRGNYIRSLFDLFGPSYSPIGATGQRDDQHYDQNAYYIVDIKFSSLTITNAGSVSNASESVPCFKTQLAIYNKILSKVTGSPRPRFAFLICRRLRGAVHTNKIGMGIVDFHKEPQLYKMAEDAASEYRTIQRIDPADFPAILSEYPTPIININMSNTASDGAYHRQKKELALKKKDLSLIWQCGPQHKSIMNKMGVRTWDDPRFLKYTQMLMNEPRYKSIKHIVDANQSPRPKTITSSSLISYLQQEATGGGTLLFYVDFETVSDVNDDFTLLPEVHSTPPMIYMIGCGHEDPQTGEWEYKVFTASALVLEEQTKIIDDWFDYMNKTRKRLKCKSHKIVHWGSAELTFLKQAGYGESAKLPGSIDLCDSFQRSGFAITGAFTYKLKDIARAFHAQGVIQTKWEDNKVCAASGIPIDGLNAMLIVWNCAKQNGLRLFSEYPGMAEIEEYNEIDCKVMWEIVKYCVSQVTQVINE